VLRQGLRLLSGGRAEVRPARHDWRAAIRSREGAYAETTLSAAARDFAAFERWCGANGRVALPASPRTVAEFVEAAGRTCAILTVRRRLHVIRRLHQWLNLPDPTEEEAVRLAWRRTLRRAAKPPRQALGLTAQLREQLLAACPESLLGLRDRAMIAVGYDTLCRRAELVALRIEDLQPLANGTAKILVRSAKNDPAREGRFAYLSADACRRLAAWREAAGLNDGPLFRTVRGAAIGATAMNPRIVNRTLQAAAVRAGCPDEVVRRLSGHSMRVGAAQDLAIAGRSVLQIMRAGRWHSLQGMMGYVRKADVNVWSAIGRSGPAVDSLDEP